MSGNVQFDKIFAKATSSSLTSPDWCSIVKICDLIKDKKCSPKYALDAILTKLRQQNPQVSALALCVLDSIVQNCGSHSVYSELASSSFLNGLRQLYVITDDPIVLKKMKELLQTWATAFRPFPAYSSIQTMVNEMTVAGAKFPTISTQDALLLFDKPPAFASQWTCARCTMDLGIFRRRHHCRSCGVTVCWKCSNKTIKLPQFGLPGDVRVCDLCFEKMTRTSSTTTESSNFDLIGNILERLQEAENEQLQLSLAMSLSEAESKEDETDSDDEDEHSNSDIDPEIGTMEYFSMVAYVLNPGRQKIFVDRNNLLENIINSYKTPQSFELLQKPCVNFIGEDALDAGALTKEYFYTGILALSKENLNGQPIFEGQDDHRLPSMDSNLLRDGTFEAVATFMLHSAIHTGVAFIGLSPVIVKYILNAQDVELSTELPLTVKDVPDSEIQSVIFTAQKIHQSEDCSKKEIEALEKAARDVGFNRKVKAENALLCQETLLFHHIIDLRRRQLDTMRKVFKSSPLWEYLQQYPNLAQIIFPRSKDLIVPASVVLTMIDIEGDYHVVIDYFKEFIIEIEQGNIEGANLGLLFELWTGSPIIRNEILTVKADDIPSVTVHACSNEICLPRAMGKEELFKQLRAAVVFGSKGFGNDAEGCILAIDALFSALIS